MDGKHSSEAAPDPGREDLADEDQGDDGQQDGEREIVVIALERSRERRPDAAGADNADNGGMADVGV
jgi:hypothetical protein